MFSFVKMPVFFLHLSQLHCFCLCPALRENMEIQNKNDELQRELMHLRRENAEKPHLQKTIEKYVNGMKKLLLFMLAKNKSKIFIFFLLLFLFFCSLQKQQIDMTDKNKKLQKKLEEILPESIKDESKYENSFNL